MTPPQLWDLFSLIVDPLPKSPLLLQCVVTETRHVQLHLRQRLAFAQLRTALSPAESQTRETQVRSHGLLSEWP